MNPFGGGVQRESGTDYRQPQFDGSRIEIGEQAHAYRVGRGRRPHRDVRERLVRMVQSDVVRCEPVGVREELDLERPPQWAGAGRHAVIRQFDQQGRLEVSARWPEPQAFLLHEYLRVQAQALPETRGPNELHRDLPPDPLLPSSQPHGGPRRTSREKLSRLELQDGRVRRHGRYLLAGNASDIGRFQQATINSDRRLGSGRRRHGASAHRRS